MNRFVNTFDLSKNKILLISVQIAVQAMSKQKQKVTAKYQQNNRELFISFAHKSKFTVRVCFASRPESSVLWILCETPPNPYEIDTITSGENDTFTKAVFWYFFFPIWYGIADEIKIDEIQTFQNCFMRPFQVAEMVAGFAGLSKYWYILIFQNYRITFDFLAE